MKRPAGAIQSNRARYRPVWLSGFAAMSSGVPTPTTVPPPAGPMSISQSAVLMTSRLLPVSLGSKKSS